jgi:rhamnosyltransferase
MRILGHIHTFNDEDVIDRSLQALLDQTYRLDEILIVDNASTDGTLKRSFPEQVTVIRHPDNLGTSGAVVTGMRYALDKGYDWIWIFDADSAPHRDALEKLVRLYNSFSPELQAQTRLVASLPVDLTDERLYHGIVFNARGSDPVSPESDQPYYECDGTMWTGCLFKLEAVQQIGLPSADYVLDEGEFEYGYRGKRCGYKAFIDQSSIVDHNIGGQTSMGFTTYRIGPVLFKMFDFAPIRCYYVVRNTIYFWLHEYQDRNIFIRLRIFYMVSKFVVNFVLRPVSRWPQLEACLRGLRDGLFKNMHHRY